MRLHDDSPTTYATTAQLYVKTVPVPVCRFKPGALEVRVEGHSVDITYELALATVFWH